MHKTAYVRLSEAFEKGKGIRFSANEVFELMLDNAIRSVADSDIEEMELADRQKGAAHELPRNQGV